MGNIGSLGDVALIGMRGREINRQIEKDKLEEEKISIVLKDSGRAIYVKQKDLYNARLLLATATRSGRVYTCSVRHSPWPLRQGEVQIDTNTVVRAGLGFDLTGDPLVLTSDRLRVTGGFRRLVKPPRRP